MLTNIYKILLAFLYQLKSDLYLRISFLPFSHCSPFFTRESQLSRNIKEHEDREIQMDRTSFCQVLFFFLLPILVFLNSIHLNMVLQKAMAPHSSTLAWKIPWTEEPAVHGVTKSWTGLSDFTFTFHVHALEKEMATHSSVLA